MADDIYPITVEELTGRANVRVHGDIDAVKIRNTFIAIRIDKRWQRGDHSMLWRLEGSSLPSSFAFGDILRTTPLTRAVSLSCKSAIVLSNSDKILCRAAKFYKIVAADKTDSQIEIFFNAHDALAWLDD